MKLFSYVTANGSYRLGALVGNDYIDLNHADNRNADTMTSFLVGGEASMAVARETVERLIKGSLTAAPLSEVSLVAPVPEPTSCRDAYAFRQHVETARRNRGAAMIPEFDQFPVFYFTNHRAIFGPGVIHCMPDHFDQLDFELEVAVVLNRKGRNIKAEEADNYIAGYMIMNDFSARRLQMEEMKLSLGPAKGKDFATAIGPYLVTPDELTAYAIETQAGHKGKSFALEMTCAVNGIPVSKGNFADMHWTFAEIIERVSYGVDVYPGDVIGSGTVGTGCFLELNGTAKLANPASEPRWLQPDDTITMEVTGLGRLVNTVILDNIA